LSEARSSRISAIIISMARARTSGSHSASGLSFRLAPYSAASRAPTGLR
jgi:hypothetical protein